MVKTSISCAALKRPNRPIGLGQHAGTTRLLLQAVAFSQDLEKHFKPANSSSLFPRHRQIWQ
jgi:hypothetical protein